MSTIDPRKVFWPRNVGPDGRPTFLLPGEDSIDSAELRRRTAEYYRQVRGRYSPSEAIARKAIAQAREALGMPPRPEDDPPGPSPGRPPTYPRS